MTIQSNTVQSYYRTATHRTQGSYTSSPNGTVPSKFQIYLDNHSAMPQSSQAAEGTSPTAIYEQMTGRTVSAAEPSYNLSQEQIDDLKSRYDIENITAEDYKALVKEMAEMGVVSKGEAAPSYTSRPIISRPIITGIFESNTFEKNFTYDTFTEGNFIEWAENLAAKYDSGKAWILKSKDNLNDDKTNKRNVEQLQKSGDSVRCMLQVLNQLQ